MLGLAVKTLPPEVWVKLSADWPTKVNKDKAAVEMADVALTQPTKVNVLDAVVPGAAVRVIVSIKLEPEMVFTVLVAGAPVQVFTTGAELVAEAQVERLKPVGAVTTTWVVVEAVGVNVKVE